MIGNGNVETSLQKYIDSPALPFNDIVKSIRSTRSPFLAQMAEVFLGNGHNNFFRFCRDRQTVKWQGGPFDGPYIIHRILSYITLSAGTKIRLVRTLPQNLSPRLNANTVGEQMSRSSWLRSPPVTPVLFTRFESASSVAETSPKNMWFAIPELWANSLMSPLEIEFKAQ